MTGGVIGAGLTVLATPVDSATGATEGLTIEISPTCRGTHGGLTGLTEGVSRENWSGQKLVRADHFSLPKLVRPRTTFGYQKWSGLPKVVRGVTDG